MTFWAAKTKIRRSDKIFSEYLRTIRGWKCEKCGRLCDKHSLTVSHFHGRRKESVRFDLENTSALCRVCHLYLDDHKTEYESWMREKLGNVAFDWLMLRANSVGKRDDKLQCLFWGQKLKELKQCL